MTVLPLAPACMNRAWTIHQRGRCTKMTALHYLEWEWHQGLLSLCTSNMVHKICSYFWPSIMIVNQRLNLRSCIMSLILQDRSHPILFVVLFWLHCRWPIHLFFLEIIKNLFICYSILCQCMFIVTKWWTGPKCWVSNVSKSVQFGLGIGYFGYPFNTLCFTSQINLRGYMVYL